MKSPSAASVETYPGKRIESLDILRGLAIISIVVLHRLHYNWTAAGPGRNIEDGVSRGVLYLLFYLITMAGIFSLISEVQRSLAFNVNKQLALETLMLAIRKENSMARG